MKILDHIHAKKVAKEEGKDYTHRLNQWKSYTQKLQQSLTTGTHEEIKVTTDDMPFEQIYFYNINGSFPIENEGVSTISATVIDTCYNCNINYMPSYMLIKTNGTTQESPNISNTAVYKVSYTDAALERKNKQPYYTVETMVTNTNPATNDIFPYIFHTTIVTVSGGRLDTPEITHYPDVKYDTDSITQENNSMRALRLYQECIMTPVKNYARSPRSTFEMNK